MITYKTPGGKFLVRVARISPQEEVCKCAIPDANEYDLAPGTLWECANCGKQYILKGFYGPPPRDAMWRPFKAME